MDPGRAFADTLLTLKHRHGDTWHAMVEIRGTHGVAEREVEREWATRRIFRCEVCADEILVETPPELDLHRKG